MYYYIWLKNIPGIGSQSCRSLARHFGSPEKVYHASYEELIEAKDIGHKKAMQILACRDLEYAKRTYDKCQKDDILIIPFRSEFYPELASDIDEMPYILYAKGRIKVACREWLLLVREDVLEIEKNMQ